MAAAQASRKVLVSWNTTRFAHVEGWCYVDMAVGGAIAFFFNSNGGGPVQFAKPLFRVQVFNE
jgi:hypothetical protein